MIDANAGSEQSSKANCIVHLDHHQGPSKVCNESEPRPYILRLRVHRLLPFLVRYGVGSRWIRWISTPVSAVNLAALHASPTIQEKCSPKRRRMQELFAKVLDSAATLKYPQRVDGE